MVKIGDRVKCVSMLLDPCPIKRGDTGTVRLIDGLGQIHVDWDSGRSLALIPGLDRYEVLIKK